MIDYAEIGRELRRNRIRRGLEIKQVAQRSQLSYTTIWKYETGGAGSSIRLDFLEAICRVIKCKPADIITSSEGKHE